MSGFEFSIIPMAITAALSLLTFVDEVQDAPSDISQLSLEMSQLCSILNELHSFQTNGQPATQLPSEVESQLGAVLMSCMDTFRDITVLLTKYTKGGKMTVMQRMRWSVRGMQQAEKLRRNLETHKATLGIAVGLIVQTTVVATAQTMNQVHGNTETIIAQIHDLIARLDPDDAATVVAQASASEASYTLRRFLSCASSYAESTIPLERRRESHLQHNLDAIKEAEPRVGVKLYDAPVQREAVEEDEEAVRPRSRKEHKAGKLMSFGHNPFTHHSKRDSTTLAQKDVKQEVQTREVSIKETTVENNPFILLKTRPTNQSITQKYSGWW